MLTEQESEMLGTLLGDGTLSRVGGSVQITITGNKLDDEEYLLNHVRPLFEGLFKIDLKARYRQRENTMDLYTYSKKIALQINEWGMPIGLKNVGKLKPNRPLDEKSFIRGMFDTDGCVYRKYGKYAQIQFKSASPSLMEYLKRNIEKLGFHPTLIQKDDTRFKFYLCRQDEIDKFFETILPANRKHMKRFKELRESSPLGIKTGSRIRVDGFADHHGMKSFWSGEETRRNGDEPFRGKIVGSSPTGPTKRRTAPLDG